MNLIRNITLMLVLAFSSSAFAAEMMVKSGEFVDADFGHNGTGQVILVEEGGNFSLKFDDFYVTPGPDLYVMLISNPTPENSQDVLESEFLKVAKLTSPSGKQTYALPDDVDIDQYAAVVIWCQQYSVLFAHAEIK